MAKPKTEVVEKAKKANVVQPKEVEQIDGVTAKVVAVFTDVDYRASNGGAGHRKGYVVADKGKQAILIGETTLRRSFPNAMDESTPEQIGAGNRNRLKSILDGLKILHPCGLLEPGTAKTRPTYAKPNV